MVYHDTPAFPSREELREITGCVLAKLGGRLRDFDLESEQGQLVLMGSCSSYHVKQLVQEEVMGLSTRPISRNEIVVAAP